MREYHLAMKRNKALNLENITLNELYTKGHTLYDSICMKHPEQAM